jgi:riboflavin biosynthesis pyrimidine reductase
VTPRFRALYGDVPDGLDAAGLVEHVHLTDRALDIRPYVVVNMVATLDGRAVIDGRAGPIGNEADRRLFHALRTRGDAVMAGAGTVRVERYGRLTREELRPLRARAGVRLEPLAVVVSRSLRLPTDLPLLQEEGREVAVITESEADLPPTPARVTYLRGSLEEGLRRLRTEHGVRAIVCEGGPHLNRSLFPAGLADELFLSTSPLLAGGEPPLTILQGASVDPPLRLELVWLLESEQCLFARYRLPSSEAAAARPVRTAPSM